ncbi:protein neprosin-like [Lolium perenne]|uniref:protein neprosin-like n=1 Tax=Lolium perenne TaxID=4522 RepID=UPI003A98D519
MTALLSFVILAMGGKEVACLKQGEDTSRAHMNHQVNKTILAEGGDVYDCIGVDVQPAFNHPLLRDHKIQMEPSSLPLSTYVESPSTHSMPQAQLPIIDCPTGTIPILRNNRMDHMAAKTIDAVIGKDLQEDGAGIEYKDELYGTRAKINVYAPKVKTNSKDFSASSIQMNGGPKPGLRDAIGAGSLVYPRYSGDSFARFHVFWDYGVPTNSCLNHDCPGFVQVSRSVVLGGRINPISSYNGPQYVIDVLIFKDPKTKNWWVSYGEKNTPIGYWPSSIFQYMKDTCDFAFWGGYVQGPTASTNSPQIGSSHFASEGFGKASFLKNIQIVDKNNNLVTPNVHRAYPGSTNSSKYTSSNYDVNNYGIHVYYGGPGDLV